MTIDELSQVLDQIQGFMSELKSLREENIELKARLNTIEEEIKTNYEKQIVELENQKNAEIATLNDQVATLETQVDTLEAQIVELNGDIEVLKEQANLNLTKAQKIVDELKVIINAKQ